MRALQGLEGQRRGAARKVDKDHALCANDNETKYPVKFRLRAT
jgi:hypothetical protein